MVRRITLGACGLDENDRLVLQSLINILELRSEVRWDFSAEAPGEISIVDLDTETGRRLWGELCRQPERVAIAYGGEAEGAPYRLEKPLRSRSVLQLLQDISRERYVSEAEAEEPPTGPATAELSGKQFFQQLIDLFESGTWALRDGEHMLLIDGPHKRAWLRGRVDALAGMARKSFSRIQVLPIEEAALETASRGLDSVSAAALIWYFARHHSLALQGDLANCRYRLRRWPNLRQLGVGADDARFCALLSRRWIAFSDLELVAGTQAAIGLLNALAATGLLQTRPADQAASADAAAPASGGLFSRIRRRLGVGS